MLVGQAIFMVGYTRTYEGRSEMRPLAERIWADYPNAAVYNVVEVGKRIPPDLSIYLNRVIPWVQRLDEIPPEPRPQIYVQRWQGEGQPPEPHVGWTQYTMVPRDVQWWVAYLRSPAEQRVIGPQQHREPATGQSGGDDHQRAH
jgi:hypothetical protein